MARLIVENRHDYDDPKTTAEFHGHIIYRDETASDLPDCEGVEDYSDGLEPDELKSDPFESRDGGYATVNFLTKNGFIAADEAAKLYHDIDQSNLC